MTPIPQHLADEYADWRWTPAWTYGDEVTTWQLDGDHECRFVKLKPADAVVRLTTEAAALNWAAAYVRVPHVVSSGTVDGVDWLVTGEMAGTSAIKDEWRADPDWLVPIVARGLRAFHETIPVADCPFRWSVADALGVTRQRIDAGLIPWTDVHAEHLGLSVEEAYTRLVRLAPEDEDAVVCHGDYCYPNVFIEDGSVTGYLDLGELSVSDRWWDVAIGMWSTTWNVGPGYEELFVSSYGVDIDQPKIDFYRLLYDFVP